MIRMSARMGSVAARRGAGASAGASRCCRRSVHVRNWSDELHRRRHRHGQLSSCIDGGRQSLLQTSCYNRSSIHQPALAAAVLSGSTGTRTFVSSPAAEEESSDNGAFVTRRDGVRGRGSNNTRYQADSGGSQPHPLRRSPQTAAVAGGGFRQPDSGVSDNRRHQHRPHHHQQQDKNYAAGSNPKDDVLAKFFSRSLAGDRRKRTHHPSATLRNPPLPPPSNEHKNEVMNKFFSRGRQQQQQQQQQLQRRRSWDPRGGGAGGEGNKSPGITTGFASPGDSQEQQVDPLHAMQQKIVEKTSSSDAKKRHERRMDNPTDISRLRAALYGDRDTPKRQPSKPGSRRSSSPTEQGRGSPSGTTRMSSAATKKATASSSSDDLASPLSDFIRRMQLELSERQQASEQRRGEDKFDPFGDTDENTPLPQWRLATDSSKNRLRDMRRRQWQRNEQSAPNAATSDWGQREHKETKRPVYVNPKDQVVVLPLYDVSLTEASLLFREKSSSLRRTLRSMGLLRRGQINDDEISLDVDTMELLALELGKKFERPIHRAAPKDEEILLQRRAASEEETSGIRDEMATPYESLPTRPPVVCIMGHVDHGKTTLMDALRRRSQQSMSGKGKKTKKGSKKAKKAQQASSSKNVAGTEAGGITQVISAFQVPLAGQDEAAVTFLDTPGHAAFKAMRQSGSDAADIIVLVVAADDGVSPQTVEIIDFYKSLVRGGGSGGISMVVAMNKIDKPGINLQESRYKIESQLLEHGIVCEGMPSSEEASFGPPVQLLPVSGLTGDGLDDLVEGLALQSEIMDLRADDSVRAEGVVMDARVDKGLGIVADCIVRWGSLSKGDVVVSGLSVGKVRILKDMNDKPLKKGLPSQPVRIIGFTSVPKAGEPIICVESEELAEDLVSRRKVMAVQGSGESSSSANGTDVEIQSAGKDMMHDDWKEALNRKHGLESEEDTSPIRIPVIVKADADGTLAAIRDALVQIGEESHHNVIIEPVRAGVGPVLANDIQIAKEGGASIVCFNLKNELTIEKMAEEEDVPLIGGNVIYSLLDDAKDKFAAYLPPEPVEVVHGKASVQQVFDIGGVAEKVAGLQVTEGKLYKDKAEGTQGTVPCRYRIVRDGKVISTKDLRATTLKHFKDDVDEIGRGKECGLSLSDFSDYEAGDIVECYSIEMRREFM